MKMYAVVVNKDVAGDVEVVERELRPLEYGEALVEVEYCHVPCFLRLRQWVSVSWRLARVMPTYIRRRSSSTLSSSMLSCNE